MRSHSISRSATPRLETAYNDADTPATLDTRIQNQVVRTDTVLEGEYVTLGTPANDVMNGTAGTDKLKGLAGNDRLNGTGGTDILIGGLGADILDGGTGTDTASYENAASGVSVSLWSGRGTFGEAVGDRLFSVENLTGSPFDDVLTGNGQTNVIHGGAGNDVIEGEGGADQLFGDEGDDDFVIEGSPLIASINGGAGFDTIRAGAGNATLNWSSITGIEAISSDGYGNFVIAGSSAANTIDLSGIIVNGVASIQAKGGNDAVLGSSSDDVILGQAGNDQLNGNGGADTIRGGVGLDTLTGGAAVDKFVFGTNETGKTNALADTITDFLAGSGEKIDLSLIDANTANGGSNDAFSFIGSGAFSHVAGELRYNVVGSDLYLRGDMNGDGVADLVIHLLGVGSVAGTDFVL